MLVCTWLVFPFWSQVELSGEGTESESSEDTSDNKDGEAALNRDAPAPSVRQEYIPTGNHDHPPTIDEVKLALDDIKNIGFGWGWLGFHKEG